MPIVKAAASGWLPEDIHFVLGDTELPLHLILNKAITHQCN